MIKLAKEMIVTALALLPTFGVGPFTPRPPRSELVVHYTDNEAYGLVNSVNLAINGVTLTEPKQRVKMAFVNASGAQVLIVLEDSSKFQAVKEIMEKGGYTLESYSQGLFSKSR